MKFHFHKWMFKENFHSPIIIEPKCGEFDPRSDEARKRGGLNMDRFICCHCGKTKEKPHPEYH